MPAVSPFLTNSSIFLPSPKITLIECDANYDQYLRALETLSQMKTGKTDSELGIVSFLY